MSSKTEYTLVLLIFFILYYILPTLLSRAIFTIGKIMFQGHVECIFELKICGQILVTVLTELTVTATMVAIVIDMFGSTNCIDSNEYTFLVDFLYFNDII